MPDAGELWVKLRADPSGFKQEAAGPIASAGRDLSKIFLAAFAVGGLATTITSVVKAATQHQAAFAVLDRTVKDAGASNTAYGQTLESLLEKEARLKGFSDEDLASAFQRLVSVTHNSSSAFKLLGESEDLARFRHIDLATAALALSKAQEGSATSLTRYGIIVPKITTQTDALKQRYAELTANGTKLDATQKAQYESALKLAEAHDKQATAASALAQVEARTGGAASAFADTAAGQFARLQQDFHQFEVAIGAPLLGGLADAASGLGHLIQELQNSKKAQEDAKQAAHDISVAFGDVKRVLEVVGPDILTVTDHFGGLTHSVEILAGVIVGGKLISSFTTFAFAEKTVGNEAEVAATKVTGLQAALSKLGLLGTIGVTVAVSYEVAKGAERFSKFLGGTGFGQALGIGDTSDTTFLNELKAHQSITTAGLLKFLNSGLLDATEKAAVEARIRGNDAGVKFGHGFFDAFTGGLTETAASTSLHGIESFLAGFANLGAKATLDSSTHGTAHSTMNAAAKALIQSLRDGVTTDQTDLAQLKTDMTDAIVQGAQAVDQAVQQAKQNMNTIGASLAADIGTFIDKPLNDAAQRLSDAQDRIASVYDRKSAALNAQIAAVSRQQAAISATGNRLTLQNLGREVTLPGGKPLSKDPAVALRELDTLQNQITRRTGQSDPALAAYILQYRSASLAVTSDRLNLKKSAIDARHTAAETGLQLAGDALKLRQDAAAHAKQQAVTQIANLTDLLNKGAISVPTFDLALNRILAKNHLTFLKAAKRDGIAFADTFHGQLTGLGLQEGALRAGPQRAGTGLIPSIVRPLDTLHQQQKTIAGIASQERAKQLDETKKQTELLKKIHATQAGEKFVNSLTKNPGGATKRQKDLSGVGG